MLFIGEYCMATRFLPVRIALKLSLSSVCARYFRVSPGSGSSFRGSTLCTSLIGSPARGMK